MPINKNEITKEMLEKAMQCNTAEDYERGSRGLP